MKIHHIGLLLLLILYGFMYGATAPGNGIPEPRFENRGEFTVMGVSLRDNNDPTARMRLWLDLYRMQSAIPNAVPGTEYGVTHYAPDYDPATQKGIVYLIGNEVSSVDYVPSGMVQRVVPAARYAVFEHRGAMERLGETYNYIFGEWLPTHKVRALGQDIFERYDARFSFDSEDSVLEIWVPVPPAD